eukprot:s1225_g23.t1
MLSAINYEDMAVVDEFKAGSTLFGPAQETGLWPKKFTPASCAEAPWLAVCRRWGEGSTIGPVFNALGVRVDVSQLHRGLVTVDNTEARAAELSETISKALAEKKLPRLETLILRGCMQFAASQIFGRVARRCLGVVTQHVYSAEGSSLSEPAVTSLKLFLSLLTSKIPRQISNDCNKTWFLFTGASYEPSADPPVAGLGAVLVDECGVKRWFFSERVPDQVLKCLNVLKRKTLILECEFLSILFAMNIWKDTIKQCKVVVNTDNGLTPGLTHPQVVSPAVAMAFIAAFGTYKNQDNHYQSSMASSQRNPLLHESTGGSNNARGNNLNLNGPSTLYQIITHGTKKKKTLEKAPSSSSSVPPTEDGVRLSDISHGVALMRLMSIKRCSEDAPER